MIFSNVAGKASGVYANGESNFAVPPLAPEESVVNALPRYQQSV